MFPVERRMPVFKLIQVEVPFVNVPYALVGQLIVGFNTVIPFPTSEVTMFKAVPPWLEITN